ncbi:MAG TPA: GntR family transcriptional regulator [Acidimicrobiales bacterium]
MITVSVDDTSPVPPFEQVRAQIARVITTGAVPAGARLPTVRQLAHDLGLAPNTVARAYRALEEADLVETRGRRGTIVASGAAGTPAPDDALRAAARDYLDAAARLGASADEALAALRAAATT